MDLSSQQWGFIKRPYCTTDLLQNQEDKGSFFMLDSRLMEERLSELKDQRRFHSDYFDDPVVLAVLMFYGIIAQLYPVYKRDHGRIRPIFGLIVPMDLALERMRREFWRDSTMTELKAFVARNDVLTSSNINNFVRMKRAREKEAELLNDNLD
jgi:hypothetical protein